MVVAPAGPAAIVQANAIDTQLAKTQATIEAINSALSKASASAGAIVSINSGQPAGPKTDGVANEAKLIQAVAGKPTVQDSLDASERARIVAEGKSAEIAKAYATAQSESAILSQSLDKAKAELATSNSALQEAKKQADLEQSKLTDRLKAQEAKLQDDADKRVAAAESKATAERKRWITGCTIGLGAFLLAAGVVILVMTPQYPFLGKNAAFAAMVGGGTLIAVGVAVNAIENLIDSHPWVIWAGLGATSLLTAVAMALVYSNHFHHKETAPK